MRFDRAAARLIAMTIGFDGHFITGRVSGNGVSTQMLLQALAAVDSENDYIVYLLQNNIRLPNPNFHAKIMPALHANAKIRFLFTFPFELSRSPVDVFHATFTVPLLPDKMRPKIVLTVPEIPWFTDPETFPAPSLFSAQVRLATRYSISKAARIITLTQFMKRRIVCHFQVPDENVEVIPWGVDEAYFRRVDRNYIEKVQRRFSITRPYVLCVGDLHLRKNQTALIRAFTQLRERHNIPYELVLAGKPHYRAELIYAAAAASSAATRIKLTGYVDPEELRALYQGASIFAFPSLHEGFGLPVHEAMASAVPVIASDRDALPEVAGDAALFVDPLDIDGIASAILRLIDDASLRERLVETGMEQARRFSWRETGRKVIATYRKVFPEGSGAAA
jgi:glycosyltransferase involved in cell wall biosynthesis